MVFAHTVSFYQLNGGKGSFLKSNIALKLLKLGISVGEFSFSIKVIVVLFVCCFVLLFNVNLHSQCIIGELLGSVLQNHICLALINRSNLPLERKSLAQDKYLCLQNFETEI